MRSTIVTITFAVILSFTLRVDACFSEGLRQIKMDDYKKRCRDLGLKESEITCLLNEGDKYEPREYTVHGQVFTCFPDLDYSRHMVSAMSVCIKELEPVAVRALSNGEKEVVEPEMEPRVLRRPVEPTTPMRKVAHWLGLKETVRGSCGCTSGCHYCCVNTGLNGDDMCFRLWCGGYGYCR